MDGGPSLSVGKGSVDWGPVSPLSLSSLCCHRHDTRCSNASVPTDLHGDFFPELWDHDPDQDPFGEHSADAEDRHELPQGHLRKCGVRGGSKQKGNEGIA